MSKPAPTKLTPSINNFRSSLDEQYTEILFVSGKGKPPVEVIHAPYSDDVYYYIENSRYDTQNGEDMSDNIIIRIGVEPIDGKLCLKDGYSRDASIVLMKSARHAKSIVAFFEACVTEDERSETIWDNPNNHRESGYTHLSKNCGILNKDELDLLQTCKKDGQVVDYLIIEGSKSTSKGMKTLRHSKQVMLFADDVNNFEKWSRDVADYKQEAAQVLKTSLSFASCIKTAANILEHNAQKETHTLEEDSDQDTTYPLKRELEVLKTPTTKDGTTSRSKDFSHNDEMKQIIAKRKHLRPAKVINDAKTESVSGTIEDDECTVVESDEESNNTSEDEDSEEILELRLKLAEAQKKSKRRKTDFAISTEN